MQPAQACGEPVNGEMMAPRAVALGGLIDEVTAALAVAGEPAIASRPRQATASKTTAPAGRFQSAVRGSLSLSSRCQTPASRVYTT